MTSCENKDLEIKISRCSIEILNHNNLGFNTRYVKHIVLAMPLNSKILDIAVLHSINDNCIIDDIDDSALSDVFNMFYKHRESKYLSENYPISYQREHVTGKFTKSAVKF